MSRIAVAILNFNGEKLLREFLPSVIRFSPNADIIVIDNGSTDDSVNVLSKEFPSVRVVLLPENFGFCGGYNRGLKDVKAEYYILLNSDIEVTEHWIEPMLSLLERQPMIGAVQPKILSYRLKDQFEYAGAGGGFIDTFGYPFCRGRIFDSVEKDHHQYDDERPVFWATGACIMVRAELYHRFGLDEDFFAHMEEIDLCWKMQRAGFEVYYTGKSTVYHLGAGTLGYASPKKTYLNFRNGLAMLTKHFSKSEMILKLPVRIMLDWVAGIAFLLKGESGNARAVARAHIAYFKNIGRILQKRSALQSAFPSYPRNTIYPGLVLFAYYVRRRRRKLV